MYDKRIHIYFNITLQTIFTIYRIFRQKFMDKIGLKALIMFKENILNYNN